MKPAALPDAPAVDLKGLLEAYERGLILSALETAGGRQRRAAGLLGILPTTLNEKMKRLGIRSHPRSPAGAAAHEVGATLRWSGRLGPGGTLEIRSLTGPLRVEAADGDQVEIVATRVGVCAAGSTIEIRIVERTGGLAVCAAGQGLAGGAGVHVVARVPPGVPVAAGTLNDDIEIVGLTVGVAADSAGGQVHFLPAPASPSPRLSLVTPS